MQPHDRTEAAEGEPPYKKLFELLGSDIAAVEAADVGGPPGDARKAHVEACAKLVPKRAEGGVNIAGPYERAVALGTGPGTAEEIDDILLPCFFHALVSHACIVRGIPVSDFKIRAEEVAVMLVFVAVQLRFGLVQPEHPDAFVVVILFDFSENEFPCAGVRHVRHRRRCQEIRAFAVFGTDQIAFFQHFLVIHGIRLHSRPDRNHQRNTHFAKLVDHTRDIRPVLLIEFPVALMRPVEIVRNDHIERNVLFFVAAGNLHDLVLRLVTELALPEAHAVFGHHRNGSGDFCVGFFNFRRTVARDDPVVHLFCGLCDPLGQVLTEGRMPDRRVVPEHAVTAV